MSTRGEIPIDLHITPIDGRNYHKIKALSAYFSEQALNRERIYVEIQYLLWLSKYGVIRKLSKKEITILSSIPTNYHRIRDIESEVNHDVKAIELYIQEIISKTTLKDIASMVHFGLTSEDINSCAYARCINGAMEKIIIPIISDIHTVLQKQARQYIIHGHVAVKGKRLNVPSYLVLKDEENKISFYLNSKLNNESHPERSKPNKDLKEEKKHFEEETQLKKDDLVEVEAIK